MERQTGEIFKAAGFFKDRETGAWLSHSARKMFSRQVIRDHSVGWLKSRLADRVPRGEFFFYMNRAPESEESCRALLTELRLPDLKAVVKAAVT